MTRILVSSSTFPLDLSDTLPRFVYDLANALTAHGEVCALVPDAPGVPRETRLGGVEVRRFRYFVPRRLQVLAYGHGMADNLRRHPLAWLQTPLYVTALARATRRLATARGIEVVNSHWIVPQGLAVAWARGRRPRFRHVLSVHAGDVFMLAKLPFGRRLARYVLDRSDAVFADGSHVSARLESLAGRPIGAEIQPMGAHLELFRNAPPRPADDPDFPSGYLLFFGRLSEKKGVVYLLRALPRVLQRHPGLGLVVVGYGALEESLRREVARLGLESKVRFVGPKTHEEIASYLASCRLSVVPSIVDRHGDTEGMPTVVIEAMAAGVGVVASAVDGIPDVISHQRNGWLCREKDPEDLADKICHALVAVDDPAVRREITATAERHSWRRVAARYALAFSGEGAPGSGSPAESDTRVDAVWR